jgi:hypothetical protein
MCGAGKFDAKLSGSEEFDVGLGVGSHSSSFRGGGDGTRSETKGESERTISIPNVLLTCLTASSMGINVRLTQASL